MRNQLKNLCNNVVSEVVFLLIGVCMIFNTLSLKTTGEWTDLAEVTALAGGFILLCWLVWGSWVLIRQKKLTELPPVQLAIVQAFSWSLLTVWCYISGGWPLAVPFGLFFLWQEYQLIQSIRNPEE